MIPSFNLNPLKSMVVINLDDMNVWFWTCEQWIMSLFKWMMPMVIENLVIMWHWNTLQFTTIFVGVFINFLFIGLNRDIMYTYYIGCGYKLNHFEATNGFALEGVKIGKVGWSYGKIMCVNVNHAISHTLMAKLICLWCCMLCEQSTNIASMTLICNQCSKGWHMGCLMPLRGGVLA